MGMCKEGLCRADQFAFFMEGGVGGMGLRCGLCGHVCAGLWFGDIF